jgi:hypothetical protein
MTYTLCAYKSGKSISGHWCSECPKADQYNKIEKAQKAALAMKNNKLKESKRAKN